MPALRKNDDNGNDYVESTGDTINNSINAPLLPQNTSTNDAISTTTTIPSSTDENDVPVDSSQVLAPPANNPTHNTKYPLQSSLNNDLMNHSQGAEGLRFEIQNTNVQLNTA